MIAKCRLKNKSKMCERLSGFKVLMREWGYDIPDVCMQLLDDAYAEIFAKSSCVVEFQRQLQAVKKQNKQLAQANNQLQEANKKMVVRLKEAYEHARNVQNSNECIRAENAHLLDRYNKQRAQLIKVCNANDELAVNSTVNQKALKLVLDCLSTEDAMQTLTPEQRSDLSRLTSESFSDQLRAEVRRELYESLKK